jgi:hypothetical protein
MEELQVGLLHWTAYHEGIGQDVHSAFHVPSGTLIDPMVPEDGLGWFERHEPGRALLTNRHHLRGAPEFAEAFGVSIHCHPDGLHEFEGGPEVEGFAFGDRLADEIVALEVDAICPEETALHIELADGALAFADGLIRHGGEPRFVSDYLLGDDPEGVKRGLRDSFSRLLERRFDCLLFAHGEPLVGGAGEALAEFIGSPRSAGF